MSAPNSLLYREDGPNKKIVKYPNGMQLCVGGSLLMCVPQARHTKEAGKITNIMDRVLCNCRMVISTLVNGFLANVTARESIFMQVLQ